MSTITDVQFYRKQGSLLSTKMKTKLEQHNISYEDRGNVHSEDVITNLSTWAPDDNLENFPFIIYKIVQSKYSDLEISQHKIIKDISGFSEDFINNSPKKS